MSAGPKAPRRTTCPNPSTAGRVGVVSGHPEDSGATDPAALCPGCDGTGRAAALPCPFCDGSGARLAFHHERLSIAMAMRGLEGPEAEAEVVLWELFGPDWRGSGWLPEHMRGASAAEVLGEVDRSLADGE